MQGFDLVAERGRIERSVESRNQIFDRLLRVQVHGEVAHMPVALRPSGGEALFDDIKSICARPGRFRLARSSCQDVSRNYQLSAGTKRTVSRVPVAAA